MCSPTRKHSQPSPFWVFMEASLHRHNRLNRGPLVIELNLQPLSPPQWWETESSNPLVTWLASLTTRPHPQVLSKSPLININPIVMERGLLWTTGNPFHLYGSEAISGTGDKRTSIMTKDAQEILIAQETLMRMKTKYIFIISHASLLFCLCAHDLALVFLSLSFSEIGVWLCPC